jgi:archaellin
VIEVSGTDGRGGNLTDFQEIMKLSPGSDPIKLDQIIFTFNTKDKTSTMKYRGTNGICDKNNVNGYNTWNDEEINSPVGNNTGNYTLAEDLDDDGADDSVYVADGTTLTVSLSSAGDINITIDDISDASSTPVAMQVISAPISNATETFGYITISGTAYENNTIPANATFTVTPYKDGEGYFTVIYEQRGTNHVAGNLQRGDILRICLEAPGEIVEDEEVRMNFIPKIGTATLTQFVSPDVISTERVYLYP